jgi:hypothetical protein
VSLASTDTTCLLPPLVLVHLREAINMFPLDLSPGIDIILEWDWISSQDLQFLYLQGTVSGTGFSGPLSLQLLSRDPSTSSSASVRISLVTVSSGVCSGSSCRQASVRPQCSRRRRGSACAAWWHVQAP